MTNKRIAVAMSGGVDSSVAAAKLKEKGYQIFGITMRLGGIGAERNDRIVAEARKAADRLEIEHHVADCSELFEQAVIGDFLANYLCGKTPNPCIRCNKVIKFGSLMESSQKLGADALATGHYVQKTFSQQGIPELYRGVDPVKDQSYFLFSLSLEQLAKLEFPLGSMTKENVRAQAVEIGLPAAARPESQDICFIPDGDYVSFIKANRSEAFKAGDIAHMDGRVLGQHQGVIHYTIGQRRGLGIGGGYTENNEPLYVIELDAINNKVVVGPKEALDQTVLRLHDCNWLAPECRKAAGIAVLVKFRSVMKPVPARLLALDEGRAEITFDAPQYGISPGQAAVCYDQDRVLGGGWIETLPE